MKPPLHFNLTTLLQEMEVQGAEQPLRLIERLGHEQYEQLIAEKYLRVIPVQRVRELTILGPLGREAIGKSKTGTTVPESALGQFYRRRLRESLEDNGWCFESYLRPDYKPDPMPVYVCGEKRLYTLCKGSEYSTQTVRRVLGEIVGKLYGSGQLLLVTEKPQRFRYLVAHPTWRHKVLLTALKLTQHQGT